MKRLPFESYSPDLPTFGNKGTTVLRNVIPVQGGFRPFPSLVTYSDALTARCQGAIFVTDSSGDVFGFAGDSTKLYALSGGVTAWDDVSKVAGYTTGAEDRWSFTQFGDLVLATNFTDDIQSFDLTSSTDFDDLTGSPPKAKYLATGKDFVVAAFLDGEPQSLQWCAIGDPTNWPTPGTDAARIVQADSQVLSGDGGWIQGIVGGLAGADFAILMQRALFRMVYVQPPVIFAFDQVEGGRGTPAPGSIAQVGGVVYYLGEDGFYRFDGQSSTPIGTGRVDRTFFDTVDPSNYHMITAGVDPVRKIIVWAYPDSEAASGIPNRLLIYRWDMNEWADGAGVEVEQLVRSMSFGVNLDTDLNVNETLLDDDSWPSLDSGFWVGGRPGFSGFDSDHKLGFFSGVPLEATLQTGEFELEPGRNSLINYVMPLIDTQGGSSALTTRVDSRYRLVDAPTTGQAYSLTSGGHCFARSRGRYHSVTATVAAGESWQFAQGLDVDGLPLEGHGGAPA